VDVTLLFTIFKNVHFVRNRQHIGATELAAEECVEQRLFSGFYFTYDYEKKRLAQTRDQFLERVKRLLRRACFACEIYERGKYFFQFRPDLEVIVTDHSNGVVSAVGDGEAGAAALI
jgi:hypothetical protein